MQADHYNLSINARNKKTTSNKNMMRNSNLADTE